MRKIKRTKKFERDVEKLRDMCVGLTEWLLLLILRN